MVEVCFTTYGYAEEKLIGTFLQRYPYVYPKVIISFMTTQMVPNSDITMKVAGLVVADCPHQEL